MLRLGATLAAFLGASLFGGGCGRAWFDSVGRGDAAAGGDGSVARGDSSVAGGDGAANDSVVVSDAPPAACPTPVASLTDDFQDNLTGAQWQVLTPDGVTATEQNGVLIVTLENAASGAQGGYGSTGCYTLRGSRLSVSLSGLTCSTGSAFARLSAFHPTTQRFAFNIFSVSGSNLGFDYATEGGNASQNGLTYDAAAHRYLQLRESGGTVYYEASPDGTSWTTLQSFPMASAGDGVLVRLFLQAISAGATCQAVFDNVNLP